MNQQIARCHGVGSTNADIAVMRPPAPRRRPYRLNSLFEVVACSCQGVRLRAAGYRQGPQLNGLARCYQFRAPQPDGEGEQADPRRHDPPVCAVVRKRLRELFTQDDLDLLYLRFVAGWSQSDIARQQGCHRSTIKRREDRLVRLARADVVLLDAAGSLPGR